MTGPGLGGPACPNGHGLRPGVRFCPVCGTPVATPPDATSSLPIPDPTSVLTPGGAAPAPPALPAWFAPTGPPVAPPPMVGGGYDPSAGAPYRPTPATPAFGPPGSPAYGPARDPYPPPVTPPPAGPGPIGYPPYFGAAPAPPAPTSPRSSRVLVVAVTIVVILAAAGVGAGLEMSRRGPHRAAVEQQVNLSLVDYGVDCSGAASRDGLFDGVGLTVRGPRGQTLTTTTLSEPTSGTADLASGDVIYTCELVATFSLPTDQSSYTFSAGKTQATLTLGQLQADSWSPVLRAHCPSDLQGGCS
jgi:hypothetical protein